MPTSREYRPGGPAPIGNMDWQKGIALSKSTVAEIVATLNHARTFITSRQKMSQTGVELYDELIANLAREIG